MGCQKMAFLAKVNRNYAKTLSKYENAKAEPLILKNKFLNCFQ